jgi:SlyX protein
MPVSGNARMEHANEVDRRLTELEIKVGFTEDLVDALNALVARQQDRIDLLTREIAELRQQQAASGEAGARSLRDELPPHY